MLLLIKMNQFMYLISNYFSYLIEVGIDLRLKNVEFMNADKMHFLEKYVSMNNFYNG